MKKLLLTALAVPTALFAGTVVDKNVIEEPVCAIPFTGSVAVGYESTYLFRGIDFGDNAPWASVDLSFPLGADASLDIGTWYINPTSPTDKVYPTLPSNILGLPNGVSPTDELDVYAFVNFPLWIFDAGIGTVFYYYPEASGTVDGVVEPQVTLGYSTDLPLLGAVDLGVLAAYDTHITGFYYEGAVSKSIPLTDCLSLGLRGGIAYGDGYYSVTGWNHAFATTGLTWKLTEAAAFDVYVGGNFPLNDLEDAGQGDDVHGGASISVGF